MSPLDIRTSQLMSRTVVKLPLIASILKVCVFNVKTLYEIAYSSMSLLYGMTFTFSTSQIDCMLAYTPHRYYGVHFDRLSVPSRNGSAFDNRQDDRRGCHGLFPGHLYFPHHLDLLHYICEGEGFLSPMQRYLVLRIVPSRQSGKLEIDAGYVCTSAEF